MTWPVVTVAAAGVDTLAWTSCPLDSSAVSRKGLGELVSSESSSSDMFSHLVKKSTPAGQIVASTAGEAFVGGDSGAGVPATSGVACTGAKSAAAGTGVVVFAGGDGAATGTEGAVDREAAGAADRGSTGEASGTVAEAAAGPGPGAATEAVGVAVDFSLEGAGASAGVAMAAGEAIGPAVFMAAEPSLVSTESEAAGGQGVGCSDSSSLSNRPTFCHSGAEEADGAGGAQSVHSEMLSRGEACQGITTRVSSRFSRVGGEKRPPSMGRTAGREGRILSRDSQTWGGQGDRVVMNNMKGGGRSEEHTRQGERERSG